MNDARICIPVCAETADRFLTDIKRAEGSADIVELRLDYLPTAEREKLIPAIDGLQFSKPLLATFRSKEQGGHSDPSVDQRREFWRSLPNVVWGVDLEEDAAKLYDGPAVRIVSLHDFSRVPVDLEAIFERLDATGADIVKVACQTDDAVDAIPLWRLIDRAKSRSKEVLPIAMGEAGKWTRILGPSHGAFMTYASLAVDGGTAPGQITADDLHYIYRIKSLNDETCVYGVIGDPIAQSLSPYMQNAAFAMAKLNAVFVPLLVKDIAAFMTRMVRPATREIELNFGGFSVTMPHKRSIIPHLDRLDPVAEKIGAVNTVEISGGTLTGHNTDAHGFITPLKRALGDIRGLRVALCGAGGASRACAYALREEGAEVTVFARDEAKSEALAGEFGIGFGQLTKLTEPGARPGAEFDILVNATPIGMKGPMREATLFTAEQIDGARLVFDLVTSGEDTPLIREAKAAGAMTIGGGEMLIAQGARQFEIWTGLNAPLDVMRDAVLKRI